MAIQSGGELVLSDSPAGLPLTHIVASDGMRLLSAFASYAQIYKRQLWVYVLVRKRALATRRLPFKTYRRTDEGREDARDTPLGQLLAAPNPRHSGPFLWEWTSSTLDIYGEAIWLKVRGRDGRPIGLWPVHPSNIVVRVEGNTLEYVYGKGVLAGGTPQFVIPERDVIHFRTYNPDSTIRGLSPLEPLRETLINEDAARRATSAFWRNAGRPSVALSHPNTLSPEAAVRLRENWNAVHGGAENFGKVAILEEGMKPEQLSLTAEEAQYVETRKLNREEACAAYDVPPPVVHILDRATFSNITEQMRSMYRDTMAPHLGGLEATLAYQLVPEFGADLYCEFLMDEVLRGAFEIRAAAYQAAINAGWITPAEVRELENFPFIEGSDRLLVNSTMVPVEEASRNSAPPATVSASLSPNQLRVLGSRLGRPETLEEVDPGVLTAGLNGQAQFVRDELAAALAAGDSVAAFRERLATFVAEPEPDPVMELAKSVAELAAKPPVNVTVEASKPKRIVYERDEDNNLIGSVEEPV